MKHVGLVLLFSMCIMAVFAQKTKHSFELSDSVFLLDGKPFQIISGEMHYPRIPREAWRHRVKMAKSMGLNTIGTYIFWNLHQPHEDVFDFNGQNDIVEFVKIAQEEGLWVILRPSPYVCAEWEFGGYPYWLQNTADLKVRSTEPQYLASYRKYIHEVGRLLAPWQINHGGNILMVQVENEYGSYGSDKEYLEVNRKLFVEAGFDGLLYTCDPAPDLVKGHLPGLLPAVNGLDKPSAIRKLINENHNGKGPYFIAEWYPAWFDWWGTKHHIVPAHKYTKALDSVLAAGISINMYMFHGGTTRNFMNGANYKGNTPYEPQISSYDYDAPLDEAGNATHKFFEFRNVIKKYLPAGNTLPDVAAAKPTIAIPHIQFNKSIPLTAVLPAPKRSDVPASFEKLEQAYGYVLYRTKLKNPASGMLVIKDLRDYAVVMVNGKTVGTLDRCKGQDSLMITLPKGNVVLDLLVENLGRINFGPFLLENEKGITKGVWLNGKELKRWENYSLPFTKAPVIKAAKHNAQSANAPVIREATFMLEKTGDTYLNMSAWGKGVVWVNGHNLGRYWNVGPQQTLYIPAEWLVKGKNELIVLEMIETGKQELSALEKPILDSLTMH
ncbi:glycoside hydrolase family 35 protein [Niastella populi]|uniref:Beta-galactosidase n=1 Tax=Niastella populi TaxID=550983 RepID=A0A1V9F396_9BACT|nr:beta-galactosidase family protein [Niastella populi]OQP52715.1 beta-galactosidase [Niastella populi]